MLQGCAQMRRGRLNCSRGAMHWWKVPKSCLRVRLSAVREHWVCFNAHKFQVYSTSVIWKSYRSAGVVYFVIVVRWRSLYEFVEDKRKLQRRAQGGRQLCAILLHELNHSSTKRLASRRCCTSSGNQQLQTENLNAHISVIFSNNL